MNWGRTILYGAFIWVLIFFEVSILMFGFELQGLNYYAAHYVLLAIIIALIGSMYFNKRGTKKSAKEGLKAGLVFLAVELVLDAIITVPLFIHSYLFFLDPMMFIGYLEGIFVMVVLGALRN